MDFDDIDSASDMVAVEPTITGIINVENMGEITALACHESGEYIFCGKDNGAVTLYAIATGKELQVLYQHVQGIAINVLISGSRSEVLVSADASSRFMVWRVIKKEDLWAVEGPLLDARVKDYSISQLLLDSDNKRLLVSTIAFDTIYNINNGVHHTIKFQEETFWRWANHPHDPSKLIRITAKAAHIHMWNEPSDPLFSVDMKLTSSLRTDTAVRNVTTCSDGCKLCVEFSKPHDVQPTSHVLVVSTSSIEKPFPQLSEPLSLVLKISPNMEYLIGSFGERLLFLDRRMWVCSVNLETFKDEYYQHFFIPDEWLSANRKLILKVTSKGDLVFVKQNEIAVIKRALDNKQAIAVSTN